MQGSFFHDIILETNYYSSWYAHLGCIFISLNQHLVTSSLEPYTIAK